MSSDENSPAPKGKRARGGDKPPTNTTTVVPTPKSARWVVRIGGGLALGAAAAISFQGLTGLGALIGIQHPWLLPIAIDIYAGTCTLLVLLLPAGHRALGASVWNARVGLAMSMGGNAVFRAVHLGSYTVSDGLMTFIGSWPSFIVERLLDLQGRLAMTAAMPGIADPAVESDAAKGGKTPGIERQAATAAGRQDRTPAAAMPPAVGPASPAALPPAATGSEEPAAAVPGIAPGGEEGGTVIAINGNGRLSLDAWATIALPLFRDHAREHGELPTANALVKLIRAAHPELRVPASERSARNIRSATESLAASAPEAEEAEPDRGQEVA